MGATAYSFIGSVFMGLLDSDKQLVGGYRKVGNVYPLAMQVNTEQKKQISRMRENAGTVLHAKTVITDVAGSMTLREYDAFTLAWALSGGATPMTGAGGTVSGTPDDIVAVHNEYVALAHKKVSTVVVNRKAGVDAADWAGTTAISLNAYRKPTVSNGHFYKCTDDGSTGASEPTWPTDGTTVVDGTVTWQDMGTTIAVVDVDYRVNAALGMVETIAAGHIANGETLSVTYTYAAESGYKVDIGSNALIRVAMKIDGENEVDGTPVTAEFDSVVIAANGEINLITDPGTDYEEIPFSLTFETLAGQTSPGRINGVPI